MDDLRSIRQEEARTKKGPRWRRYLWRHKWPLLLTLLIGVVILFPGPVGHFLGYWAHEFITNLFQYLNL